MPSTARSISWSFWWRRLAGMIAFDLFVCVALVASFAVQCASKLPEGALRAGSPNAIASLELATDGDRPEALSLDVLLGDGTRTSFPMGDLFRLMGPVAVAAGSWQLVSLLSLPEDTRRVRRKLLPLNQLALDAEAMGSGAGGIEADKMESLEQAISRATVDSPRVTTGDQDLQPIEVALNGLLNQMQKSRQQQTRFVSDASHELRTPIAVIKGYVDMLDRWGKTDEAVLEESIESLKAETDHMQELVEQLLFLARGDSGRNALQMAPLNLAEVTAGVWEESCMIDDAHRYALENPEGAEGDPRYQMTGDLAMVKQSIRVIVQNAAKYSPTGSTITLGARARDGRVSYQVQDEGMGMGESDVAHAFERFWRADEARGGEVGGTGLGLSIAKWIVDAHQGTIDVVSREGVGTRFSVSFPVSADGRA